MGGFLFTVPHLDLYKHVQVNSRRFLTHNTGQGESIFRTHHRQQHHVFVTNLTPHNDYGIRLKVMTWGCARGDGWYNSRGGESVNSGGSVGQT